MESRWGLSRGHKDLCVRRLPTEDDALGEKVWQIDAMETEVDAEDIKAAIEAQTPLKDVTMISMQRRSKR
eukprot:7344561-Heterocapsa_arctica.AAC.1